MAICPRCSSSAVERYTDHGLSCTACGFDGATVEFAPDLRSEERKEIDASIARAAARERERCARIADQVAINAERRAAEHIDPEAKQSAYDKMQAAQEVAALIREVRAHG